MSQRSGEQYFRDHEEVKHEREPMVKQLGPSAAQPILPSVQAADNQHPRAQLQPPVTVPKQSAEFGRDDISPTTTTRGLGVHTMLNPTEPEGPRQPPSLVPLLPSPGVENLQSRHVSQTGSVHSNQGKRTLQVFQQDYDNGSDMAKARKAPYTPRSFSLGGQGTGVFLTSTKHAMQAPDNYRAPLPATAQTHYASPLPLPPVHVQHSQNLPPLQAPPPLLDRRRSAPLSAAPMPHSQSTSPNQSSSSYSSNQPSPALPGSAAQRGYFYHTPQGEHRTLQQPHPQQNPGPYSAPPLSDRHPEHGSSAPGPGNHMMSLLSNLDNVKWNSGSKDADEKRKRNAAASARFRQRRKKDNKELIQSNEKLEQQVKELEYNLRNAEQDREFYRNERDRYMGMLVRRFGMREAELQGPPSPRLSRQPYYHPQQPHPLGLSSQVEHEDNDRPARRRRRGPDSDRVPSMQQHSSLPSLYPSQGAVYEGERRQSMLPQLPMSNLVGGHPGAGSPHVPPPPPAMSRGQYEQSQQQGPGRAYGQH